MENQGEKDVEALLRRGVPVNERHKQALRERLLESTVELGLDDLEGIAGGAGQVDRLRLEDWPDAQTGGGLSGW